MKQHLPTWDLSRFYDSPSDKNLQKDMDLLEKEYAKFQRHYKNKIKSLTSKEMIRALTTLEELQDKATKIGSYASLLAAEDTTNPTYGVLRQKVAEWGSRINTFLLFFGLEWKSLPDKTAQKILDEMESQTLKHYLAHMRDFSPFILSEDIEKVILEKDVSGAQSWIRLFTQLISSLEFKMDGKKYTEAEILSLGSHTKRTVRRKAAESITKTLATRKMDLTHIYNSLLVDKMLEEKRRGYNTWIEALNISNKVTDKTVQTLVSSVSSHYDVVSSHYELKKKLLKLSQLYDYDRYAPVEFNKQSIKYSWDKAKEIAIDSYTQLSPEAGKVIQEFFDGNYIHAQLIHGKQGGAFCATTAASVHPYILVNFTGRVDDVMTLAHELGHGLHQYWASKNHGNLGHGMPLVTQELASTFGEFLVFNKLKNEISDPFQKLSLIMKKVDGIIATVFRQTAMYLFEEKVHTTRRSKGELTYDQISQIWITTQRDMFGKSVTIRDEYQGWWSYIPHFIHTPGYVYSYAFGELVALSLYAKYISNSKAFSSEYIELLKAGDSDYPKNLLNKVHVDIEDPEFWNKGIALIKEFVEEEKALVSSLNFA